MPQGRHVVPNLCVDCEFWL